MFLRLGLLLLFVITLGVTWASDDEEGVPERPAQLPAVPHLYPIADVWPEAVSTVPAEREDGTWLWPVGALDGDHLLLRTHERRPEFISINTRTNKQRV